MRKTILVILSLVLFSNPIYALENPVTGSQDTYELEPLALIERTAVESINSLINFDDILLPPPGYNSYKQITEYGGITWDSNVLDFWGDYKGGWSVYNRPTYATAVSPPNYAFNLRGAINPGFNFALPVNFYGAYFMTTSSISNPTAVRFVGYVSNIPTYYSEWLSISSTPTYLHTSFLGVDRVVVEMDGSGWFAMDDLTYIMDSDGDGIPNSEDKCPGTIEGQIVYGCSCNQILELKPGKDESGECSEGIIEVFTKQIGWARDVF